MNPTPEYIALNRATFGATAEELARVGKMGWKGWVEEQLHPDDLTPDEGAKRIKYEFAGEMAPQMMIPGGKMAMMDGSKNAKMTPSGDSESGRRLYGEWKGLANEHLDHGADLAVTTDYRTVLHEVLTKRAGLADTKAIFPGFEARKVLGFA
ncbi:MAG: DUF1800 family protein [Chthoniobacteraceae bacterium]